MTTADDLVLREATDEYWPAACALLEPVVTGRESRYAP